jgi:ankyrin repeat protein
MSELPEIPLKQPISARKRLFTKSEKHQLSTSQWLMALSPEEEAIRIVLMNHGFDARNFGPLKATRLKDIFGKSATIQADAVCWAVTQGNDIALRMLLDRGCDPSSRAKHPSRPSGKAGPIYWAIELKQWTCVWLLLDRGANVHEAGVLESAVGANKPDLVEEIIRKGVSVDKPFCNASIDNVPYHTKGSWTPLHHAACYGAPDRVKLLLRLGANVDLPTPTSQTLLGLVSMCREENESLHIVRLLIEGGASIDHMDNNGRTALHIAVSRGYRKVATLLLDKRANVNAQLQHKGAYPGNTPLHEAMDVDNPDMMQLLLCNGANEDAIGPNGLSPKNLAWAMDRDSSAYKFFFPIKSFRLRRTTYQ